MENKQVLLTAQDIEDVQFKKSLGRYETDGVDAFLDRCAETVEALTRINAENEHKMQVLGQSIVEYRAQEDTIRNALMNAQRMSDTILGEARQQAEQITAEAKEQAAHIHETAEADVQAERAELKRVQDEVASFKARLLSIYREHLTLIGVLTDEEKADTPIQSEPEAAVETPVVQEHEPEVAAGSAAAAVAESEPASAPAPETAGTGARFDLSQFTLDDE